MEASDDNEEDDDEDVDVEIECRLLLLLVVLARLSFMFGVVGVGVECSEVEALVFLNIVFILNFNKSYMLSALRITKKVTSLDTFNVSYSNGNV